MVVPEYKKTGIPRAGSIKDTLQILKKYSLHTVCEEANCPNKGECFSESIATFLIAGNVCTRGCGFCGVKSGVPEEVDPGEPKRIADAVSELGLKSVVITSPTRDDLQDGGAYQYIRTVEEIKRVNGGARIELLIPDFGGSVELLDEVISSKPDVIAHNMETVERLYKKVRPGADYGLSMRVLQYISDADDVVCKSGFMVGLGETDEEIDDLLSDLRDVGCEEVIVGQYLQSESGNLPVMKYYEGDFFDNLEERLSEMGFKRFLARPLARTSYSLTIEK